jgi:lipopolysaccharide transport system ATP-binding protein
MADAAIRITGIGKQYRRGTTTQTYYTLRDALANGVKQLTNPWQRRQARRDRSDTFWALQDVSLDVPRGAALGLIGGNGAGKSTLLKILSRVTEPTTGCVQLHGRVGSLLEVGTGFHPELTGRENVLLNGAILGMKRVEILKRFDEIVAFAEVEPFIDMTVRHYSSGMYLRLAFAVAAHLQPEILLVDEVLAVGDAAFQKRCLGRMRDVAREGRTVVFVSHNIEAVQRLCSHAVLLDGGRVAAFGDTASVVARYLAQDCLRPGPGSRIDVSGSKRSGTGDARFISAQYGSGSGGNMVCSDGPLEMLLEIESDAPRSVGSLSVSLSERYGTMAINADTVQIDRPVSLAAGRNLVRLRIAALHLTPGSYWVNLWLSDPIRGHSGDGHYDFVESAFEMEVVSANPRISYLASGVPALVTCDFDVEVLQ